MLSNVHVSANVLPGRYQEHFAQVSATDLYDIMRRCPLVGISFDTVTGTLTPQQRAEWQAHLFWGDRSVSMAEEDRNTLWVLGLAERVFPSWSRERKSLDVEGAFEWLWLCTQLLAQAHSREAERHNPRSHRPSAGGDARVTQDSIRRVIEASSRRSGPTPGENTCWRDAPHGGTFEKASAIARQVVMFLESRGFDAEAQVQQLCEFSGV